MEKNARPCTTCFVSNAHPVRSHAFVSNNAAIRLFSELKELGHFPVMCQQAHDKFQVCHEALNQA